MEKQAIKQLLKNTTTLIATNNKAVETSKIAVETTKTVVEANREVISLIKISQAQRENLLSVCVQIYQGLTDKKERNVTEESWYKGLHKAIQEK